MQQIRLIYDILLNFADCRYIRFRQFVRKIYNRIFRKFVFMDRFYYLWSIKGFMKKFALLLFGIILSSNIVFADDSKYKNEVLAQVGDEEITFEVLRRSFNKNKNNEELVFSEIPRDSLKEFLDMFIKYRLKVQFALDNKYDTLPDVVSDFNQNRRLLAESYYYDEMLFEPFILSKTERRKIEKRISIIMQSYSDFGGVDSLDALDTAQTALKEVMEGNPFSEVAKRYSIDKPSRKNGGLIDRWLTAGMFARGLEDAMYETSTGNVYPELINTRKSFWVLKVEDEEPRRYVLASHILIRESAEQNTDSIADVVLAKLNSGRKFEEMVHEYSQDPASVKTDGCLQDFYSRSTGFESNGKPVMPEFEKAMFSLRPGEISGKIRTDYGIHIIRCDSIKEVSLKTEEEELRSMYRRLMFHDAKNELLDTLAKKHGFILHKGVLNSMAGLVDTSRTNLTEGWEEKIPAGFSTETLYEMNGKKISVGEFIEDFNSNSAFRGYATSRAGFKRAINNTVRPQAFDLETENYEEENEEFAYMAEEFRDGILLFKVQEDMIWSKMKFDTAGAKEFYEQHKKKYKTDFSYDLSEILVFRDSVAQDLYERITEEDVPFDTVAKNHTQRSGMRQKNGHLGIVSAVKDSRGIAAKEFKPKKGEVLEPIKTDNGIVILKINDIHPVRQKTFEEAIPDFSAEFQEIQQEKLTEQWIENIKKDKKVIINETAIDKIFKQ